MALLLFLPIVEMLVQQLFLLTLMILQIALSLALDKSSDTNDTVGDSEEIEIADNEEIQLEEKNVERHELIEPRRINESLDLELAKPLLPLNLEDYIHSVDPIINDDGSHDYYLIN